MKNTGLTFIILVSISVLKSFIGYKLITANIEDINNLILSITQFGLILGIIGTIIYFILLAYLTYGITTLWTGNFEITFSSFISQWFNAGFLPMLLLSVVQLTLFDFFFLDFSEIPENIIYINTIAEIFFFVFGIFAIKKQFKTNYLVASISIVTPILIFQLFKSLL